MAKVVTTLVLMVLWLLLSGIYKPLIIGFGVASVLAVAWITARMDRLDGEALAWRLDPLKFTRYLLWLLAEIARANWAVTKLILAPRLKLRQHLFWIPVSQKTELAEVAFANSITLTPGTITVETEPGRFLVHALDYSTGDLDALAGMDARVSACEVAS